MADSPGARRPKLAHVAMAAGVSLGTASDALRGKGRISDATRQRVIAAAESMGYRPNANARVLALGHAEIVALVAHGPSTGAAPRIYWPRLQAAFTERLLEHGMVACTMTLDDLHQLDGLPFDLIVYASLDSPADLPETIRADYRILDIDITGDDRTARDLRRQFADVFRAALDHLVAIGALRPALLVAGVMGEAVTPVYEAWCANNHVAPIVVNVDAGEGSAHALRAAVLEGADGFFNVLGDVQRLADGISAISSTATGLPVITLGTAPRPGAGAVTISSLVPDGRSLGAQIADVALAVLHGSRRPALHIDFLLDGEAFPHR